MGKVIIMRGASGSGKSTWLSRNFPSAKVVSADHYFLREGSYEFDVSRLGEAHNECLVRFLAALEDECPVVAVDNTNSKVYEIAPYYRVAEALGYEPEIVWLMVAPEICKARTLHGVPPETIDSMIRGCEPLPSWWRVRIFVQE